MLTSLLAAVLAMSSITAARPRPGPEPEPVPVPVPAPVPVEATSFEALDFPANVLFVSGAAQFGMYVPTDGVFHDTSTITCLNVVDATYGACNIPTADLIGVVSGYGPCSFVGVNGFWDTIPADGAGGFETVAPPQVITMVACGG